MAEETKLSILMAHKLIREQMEVAKLGKIKNYYTVTCKCGVKCKPSNRKSHLGTDKHRKFEEKQWKSVLAELVENAAKK